MMCFVVIFPVTQSYSVPKIHGFPPLSTNCITTITPNNAYNTVCTDVDVDDLTAVLEKEVEVKFSANYKLIREPFDFKSNLCSIYIKLINLFCTVNNPSLIFRIFQMDSEQSINSTYEIYW